MKTVWTAPAIHGTAVRDNNRVKALILAGGGDILSSQIGQKPLRFLFAWQMKREPLEVVAISAEVTALRGQRKGLPPNDLRKPAHCCIGIQSAILTYERLFMYQLPDYKELL